MHYMECVAHSEEVDEALKYVCLQCAILSSGEKRDDSGRKGKEKRVLVADGWFG